MVQPRHSQQHVSENPQHLMLREPSVQSGVHHLQDGAAVIELHHNEDLVNIITLAADGPVLEGDRVAVVGERSLQRTARDHTTSGTV